MIYESVANIQIGQGGFSGNLNFSRDLSFDEPGYYMLTLAITDTLNRKATASHLIVVTDNGNGDEPDHPDDPTQFLTAALMPYTVKHGQTLTVFANSSLLYPWVQVWGQNYPMVASGDLWQVKLEVLPDWPLGTNYLAVRNGENTVILAFEIVASRTGRPRTRLVR